MALVAEPSEEERANDAARLQVLLLDYEMAREDERSLVSVQAAAFGVAVALSAAVTALTTQTCAMQPDKLDCVDVPQGLLAGVPLGPLAMLAFLQVLGTVATIRNYYIRALENELRRVVSRPLAALPDIQPASYFELVTTLTSMRRGRLGFRILNLVMLMALLVVFGGLTVYIAAQLSLELQLAMLAVYGSVGLLLLVEATQATVGGRRLFVNLVHRYRRSDELLGVSTAVRARRERSLAGYLLLPRPEDCLKWLFVPASLGLAVWSLGTDVDLVRALVVWGALEYLVYEARYQWNDIRGLADDLAHPEREQRGRLPVGATAVERARNVALSLGVALARVIAAAGLALLVGHGTLAPVLVLTALVLAIAIVYEWLRARARGPHASAKLVSAIWVVVGLGYPVRGLTGLWLGGYALDGSVALLAAGAFVAFGTTFVTLTWVFDALSHCHGTPLEPVRYAPSLERKPHLLRLLGSAGIAAVPDEAGAEPGPSCRTWRALAPRGAVRTPWNAGLVASAELGGAIGVGLAMRGELPAGPALLATLVTGVGAFALVYARDDRERGAATLLGAGALVALGLLLDASRPPLLALPWLVFAGVFTAFRAQSYASLKAGLTPLLHAAALVWLRVAVVLVGRDTAAAIGLVPSAEATAPGG